MTPLAKATLQASIGALLGNRSVKYALGGGVISVNTVDCFAVSMGAVTPVMLSHIAKESLSSVTGFHGITGCAIAGILTYLLHKQNKQKGNDTILNNNNTQIQTQGRNPNQSCSERVENMVRSSVYPPVKQYVFNPARTIFSTVTSILPGKKPPITQDFVMNDETKKIIKKYIATEAMVGLKALKEKSNRLTDHYTKEIDKQIPIIEATIDELLEDCSPENIIPFTQKTVHILSKLKEKKGSELEKSYTDINNNTLKPLYELKYTLRELAESIKKCNVIQNNKLSFSYDTEQEKQEKSKNASSNMHNKIEKIQDVSKKIFSAVDEPKNELQSITKEITAFVTEHAQKSYETALLKNVNYIVSDIATLEFIPTEKFKNLQTIINTLPVPELEKFKDFAYKTLDLKATFDQNKNGINLNLDELEKKVHGRLSDDVIEALNQSKTPRDAAEKELYHLLRDVKLHKVETWRKSRIKLEANKNHFIKLQETLSITDETLKLEQLQKLYPKPIDLSKAEAELDELKYVTENKIDVPETAPQIKALGERFKKL